MFLDTPVPFSLFSVHVEDFISHSMSSFLKAHFPQHSSDLICAASNKKDIMIIRFPSDMASVNVVENVLNSNNNMRGKVISISNDETMKTSIKWKFNK